MDEEERNYCCLALLLTRVGADRIRHHFIRKWDDVGTFIPWTDCAQNGTDLLTKFIPLRYENAKVKSGDTARWDLSLLVRALLNTWPPMETSPTLVRSLECMRETRNTLCHTPDGKIPPADFTKLWNDACSALVAFGATSDEFQKVERDVELPLNELTSLTKQCAKQDDEILRGLNGIITQLTKLEQNQEDIKDKLDELASSTRQPQLSTEATISIEGRVKLLTAGGLVVTWIAGSAFIIHRYRDDPETLTQLVQGAIIPTLFATVASVRAILPGSFKIVVEVRSLDALDAIWKSYMEGDMKKKLEKVLVTDQMRHLAPDDAESVDISLMISEDEYRKTRDYLVESVEVITRHQKLEQGQHEIKEGQEENKERRKNIKDELDQTASSTRQVQLLTEGNFKQAMEHYMKELEIAKQRSEKGDQEMIAQCHYDLGKCYQMLDRYSEAITNYEKSLSIYQEKGDQERIAECYQGLGNCFRMLDKYSEAFMNFKQSLSIIVNLKLEETLEGDVSYGLGVSLMELHRFQESKQYLDKALNIAKQIGELNLEWVCNFTLSQLHHRQSQFHKALDYAERAEDIANKMNGTEKQITYHVLGDALRPFGRVKEAIENRKRYLKYTQQVGNRKEEGRAFFGLCVCFENIHDNENAIFNAKKSAEIAIETGDLKTEGKAYGSIGNALSDTGELEKAMEYLIKALEIAKQSGDKESEAITLNILGEFYMKLGKHYDAIRCFETSINVNSELGLENNNGVQYNNLGLLYKIVGKYREAAEFLKQCLDMAKGTGQISREITAYQNLSMVYYVLNDANLARECRLKKIILAIQTGDKYGEIDYLTDLGKCFCKTYKITEAITNQTKALHLASKIGKSDYIAFCYASLGDTYSSFGMVNEAIHNYKKALTIYTDSGYKKEVAVCLCNMGMIFYSLSPMQKLYNDNVQYDQNIKKSEQYLRESLQCYENFFDDLREKHEFKISIVDTYVEAYYNLALLLIDTNRTTEALIVCERGRACALGDFLVCKYGMQQQQVFVENMSNKKTCQTRKPLNESDLTDLSPEQSCLLFYSIIKKSEHLWVLSQQRSLIYAHNEIQQNSNTNQNITDYIYQLADSAYQFMGVKKKAAKFKCEDSSLGKQEPCYSEGDDDPSQLNNDRMNEEPLKELFKQLITPVQEHLTQDEIIIIPDGPLNLVPFAALQDPQTGRFLCETKRIRLAPSLTTLKILKECPDDYNSKEGALVIGNPLVGEVMFRGKKKEFPNLPAAENEATAFSPILGVSPLIGIHATKDAVKEKLQEHVAVIHIAAHGDSATGEIALAPGRSAQSKAIPDEEDYILTMQEVQEIGVRAKLVVLSCCHSGRGEICAEGVVVMARAFLAAGARAVVATLWAIDDEATLDFMAGFYRHLRRGRSASVSLNKSMNELIREKKYSHPKYWAPFVLIGDDVTIF